MTQILSALTGLILIFNYLSVVYGGDYLTKLGICEAHQDGYRGQGQTIAIIDDPVESHPALAHVQRQFIFDGRAIGGQAIYWLDQAYQHVVKKPTTHGTKVTGIIAAKERKLDHDEGGFTHAGIASESSILHFSRNETLVFRKIKEQACPDDIKALEQAEYDLSKLLPETRERLSELIKNFFENIESLTRTQYTEDDWENAIVDILGEIEKSDASIINLSQTFVCPLTRVVKGRSVLSNRLIYALKDTLTKGKGRLLVMAAGNCGLPLGEKQYVQGGGDNIVNYAFLEGQLAQIHDLKDHIIFVGALCNDDENDVLRADLESQMNLEKIEAIKKLKQVMQRSPSIKELAEMIYDHQSIFKAYWPRAMAKFEYTMMGSVEYKRLDSAKGDYKTLYIQKVGELMAEQLIKDYQFDSSVVLKTLQDIRDFYVHEFRSFHQRFVRYGESNSQLTSFSNKAGCAFRSFISTYGENIVSTTGSRDEYKSFSGTSAAAPIVTGCLALLLQANPTLTPVQAWQILRDTAESPLHGPEIHGVGVLNFKEAFVKAKQLYHR